MTSELFLGCSGFYYNHWRGTFYPEKLPKTRWLEYYAEHFNTLEVNNTFYRFPSESLLIGWHQKTPANFRFFLKANRAITHTRKFHNTKETIERFYKLAFLLEEKLLGILFQLPPFVHKNMELLETIASQVDPKVVNVLEFRHKSWWDKEVYDLMKKKGLTFCTVSASELPDTLVKTTSVIYVRFHGKDGWYRQNYPKPDLERWARTIEEQNAQRVFCYFNNDFNANATKNCLTLKSLLEGTIVSNRHQTPQFRQKKLLANP